MKRIISVAEARTNLPRVLHNVEDGDTVEITRRGKPVAIVLSTRTYQKLLAGKGGFKAAYRAWEEAADPEDRKLPSGFFQELRDRSPGRPVNL